MTDTTMVVVSPPMHLDVPDRAGVVRQWEALVAVLEDLGWGVEVLPDDPVAPLRTFTRDLAIPVPGRREVLTPELDRRRDHDRAPLLDLLARRGWVVEAGPATARCDGGHVVPLDGGPTLVGIELGSAGSGARWVAERLRPAGPRVVGVPLARLDLAHLDVVVAGLGTTGLVVCPDALRGWDDPAWGELRDGRDVVEITVAEAERLAANVVVVGGAVVGMVPDRVAAVAEAAGLRVVPVDLSAFVPSRGGARCLTLPLVG